MNKLCIVLACFIFTQHAFSQTDCSELLTLSSTPASCNENGTITATVDGCSSNIGGSEVMIALYNAFNSPESYECIEYGMPWFCEEFGFFIQMVKKLSTLDEAQISDLFLPSDLFCYSLSLLQKQKSSPKTKTLCK